MCGRFTSLLTSELQEEIFGIHLFSLTRFSDFFRDDYLVIFTLVPIKAGKP